MWGWAASSCLPAGEQGCFLPAGLWCRGAVPQQIPAQSVQSSGGDERRGLGGYATTHFTGKSGFTLGDLPPFTQPVIGVVFFFIISAVIACVLLRHGGGGWQKQLLWGADRGGEAHPLYVQHFQRSLNLQPRQLPRQSPVRLSLPGPEDLGRSPWRFGDALLEGEGVGGRRSLVFYLFIYFLNWKRVRSRLALYLRTHSDQLKVKDCWWS